jgi:hypothetical protein
LGQSICPHRSYDSRFFLQACVKGVLQAEILSSVIDFTQAPDQEVSVLAMATLANVFSYSDTLLLTDTVLVETLAISLPPIMDCLRPFPSSATSSQYSESTSNSQSKRWDSPNQSPSVGPHRFYAIAALANATCHPRLAEIVKVNGGEKISILQVRYSRLTTGSRFRKTKPRKFTYPGKPCCRLRTSDVVPAQRSA